MNNFFVFLNLDQSKFVVEHPRRGFTKSYAKTTTVSEFVSRSFDKNLLYDLQLHLDLLNSQYQLID